VLQIHVRTLVILISLVVFVDCDDNGGGLRGYDDDVVVMHGGVECYSISHYLNEQGTGNEFIRINAITKLSL